MQKLILRPDQENYQLEEGVSVVASKLLGGGSRQRMDILYAPAKLTCQWTVDEDEYNYMKTFYRFIGDGTQPFLMDLLVNDSVLTEHTCRFYPNTFKLAAVKGRMYKITATLEVELKRYDDALDEGLVTSYEAFLNEGSSAYALLATIVNVDMPANLK